MSLNPQSIAAYSPNPLERKVILCHLGVRGGFLLTLLLSGFAVRIEDAGASLAVFTHEEGEVDVATTAFFVTTSDILIEHILELVVLESDVPAHQLVVVIVLGVIGPADENGVILSIAHVIKLIRVIKRVVVIVYMSIVRPPVRR